MSAPGDFKICASIVKRAALNNGLTSDEIKEAILHSAICAALPAANSAFAESIVAFQSCGIDVEAKDIANLGTTTG